MGNLPILLLASVAATTPALAQTGLPDVSGCLPPAAGGQSEAQECLPFKPPPPLGPDVLVTGCEFVRGLFRPRADGFEVFECTVTNEASEAIGFFSYGVRYFDQNSDALFAEHGFEGTNGFATESINLPPGDTRSLRFIGPMIPGSVDKNDIKIVVEVTLVFVRGSPLRR